MAEAALIVFSGWDWVPGLESEPFAASTNRYAVSRFSFTTACARANCGTLAAAITNQRNAFRLMIDPPRFVGQSAWIKWSSNLLKWDFFFSWDWEDSS